MTLSPIVVALLLVCGPAFGAASATNSIKTNVVSGATLAAGEVDVVVRLANLCGMATVTAVSTVRHMGNSTILAKGGERIEGRKLTFEELQIHRDGWEWRKRPKTVTKTIGDFWVEEPARPVLEERTIVQVGGRIYRIGLLNGIKPEGADLVLEAFLSGKVIYASDHVKDSVAEIDFADPSWIGLTLGECYITFASPLKMVTFRVKDKQVTITGVVRMYE